jgi:hypothetical protein
MCSVCLPELQTINRDIQASYDTGVLLHYRKSSSWTKNHLTTVALQQVTIVRQAIVF